MIRDSVLDDSSQRLKCSHDSRKVEKVAPNGNERTYFSSCMLRRRLKAEAKKDDGAKSLSATVRTRLYSYILGAAGEDEQVRSFKQPRTKRTGKMRNSRLLRPRDALVTYRVSSHCSPVAWHRLYYASGLAEIAKTSTATWPQSLPTSIATDFSDRAYTVVSERLSLAARYRQAGLRVLVLTYCPS